MVNEEWLSLRQASDMTGKSINALRLLVNRKRFDMVKRIEKNGHSQWMIHRDSLMKTCSQNDEVTGSRHEAVTRHNQVTAIPLEYFDGKLKEWELERDELKAGFMMYRYKFEEAEKQLKLLPVPVEVVSSRMEELERQLHEKEEALGAEVDHRGKLAEALQEERVARAQVEAELQQEKKLPWWKIIFRR